MTETVQSVAPANAPPIGQYWEGQGGIYAGIVPDYTGHEPKHLIVSAEEATELMWGPIHRVETEARSAWDGETNTKALVASEDKHPAAKWADAYEKDGHTDFHLPSRLELDAAYTTIPDQFDQKDWYWSSTERDRLTVYGRTPAGLDMEYMLKVFSGRARAVRTIPVG